MVVADDGSTDATTLQVLDALDDPRLRLLRLPHAGVSSTRNAAIEAATGQHILPLDADDRLDPTFARLASRALDASPDVGIVGAGTEFFGTLEDVFHPRPPHPVDWLLGNQLPVSAAFRKADWSLCGGYAEDLPWGEDWHFWVRLIALERRVELLPLVGLYYRRRPGQVTSRVSWKLQADARERVVRDGVPIIQRYPDEAGVLIGQQLNMLEEMRELARRPLWKKVLAILLRTDAHL